MMLWEVCANDVAFCSGSFHRGGGIDTFSHLTTLIREKDGKPLYFYREDGTYRDRVHVPESKDGPHWPHEAIYTPISKKVFDA